MCVKEPWVGPGTQRALGKSRPWLSFSLRGAGDLGFPMRDRAGSPFMGPLDAMLG